MKRIFRSLLAMFLLVAFSVSFASAEIKLPSIFCDNMILQQQTDVAIWGKAAKNSTVKVTTSWNGKSYSANASADGQLETESCDTPRPVVRLKLPFPTENP